jgi:hypothetical protein
MTPNRDNAHGIASDQLASTSDPSDQTTITTIPDVNPEVITKSMPNLDASLVNVLEHDAGIDLLRELRGSYQDDPIFKSILDRPKEFRNFEVQNELVYLKLNGKN